MKEFEKFWDDYKMSDDRISHKYFAKAGWKEALEWVADKCRGRRSEGLFYLLEEIDKELYAKT